MMIPFLGSFLFNTKFVLGAQFEFHCPSLLPTYFFQGTRYYQQSHPSCLCSSIFMIELEKEPTAAPEVVDDTTREFMEKTLARVSKMRSNTALSNEKKEALRASLSECEKEGMKEGMKEVADTPAEQLDESAMLQAQVKIRNAKF